MYSSLEKVINQVSPKRREMVLDILHNKVVHKVEYQHKLFQCLKCHKIESRFDFSFIYYDDKKFAPYFRCPECRVKLDPVEEPIDNGTCPKFGRKDLTEFTTLWWD